jgi:hypothetical protein
MKKQNVFGVRFMLISATLVASLLLVGASYAGPPAPGVSCWSATITENTLNPQIIGQKFSPTNVLSPVKGSGYVLAGKANLPTDTSGNTIPVSWSGTGHMVGDELFVEYQTRVDLPPNHRGGGLAHLTLHCNAKGRDCTGSFWEIYTGVGPVPPQKPTPPSAFVTGYITETLIQVDCPK